MDETKYAKAFELIMNAGNAKSLALMAVESAREFDFEEAQKQLKVAAGVPPGTSGAVGYDSG